MNTIEKLYNAPSYKQPHRIGAKVKGYSDLFDVDFVGNDQKPDCSVGHFGYNFYFRTNKGLKYGKYQGLRQAFTAIKRKAKSLGLEVEYFGLIKGYSHRKLV